MTVTMEGVGRVRIPTIILNIRILIIIPMKYPIILYSSFHFLFHHPYIPNYNEREALSSEV